MTNLPTRTIHCAIEPSSTCGRCAGALHALPSSTSWRQEWVPGHFERLEIVRERCVCPRCPSAGVLIAPAPSFLLPKALCGNGLLARILIDKFADHLPLNRQVSRMEREGVEFSTNVLSSWVIEASGPLQFVANAIGARLLEGAWLQADDTGTPVQDGSDGKLRKGRLWAVTDQQEVRYHFTDDKQGKHPATFLDGFEGKLLLVDGGSEFNEAVRKLAILRAGCWAHLRRYFFDARHHHPTEAHLALGTIRDLFQIEAGIWGASHDEIRLVRDTEARPLVDGFFAWVEKLRPIVRPSSVLGHALTYATNGKDSFRRFLDHPELPMHNNVSERKLRQPVVGRKNWLFARSEGGAHAAATMYSLIGSCKLQGIDPWAYLVDVLDRLSDHPANRVHELTPMAWRIARDARRPA
jgi:transposase